MQNKDKKTKKAGIGYYSVVAFSLAVIGSVSWYAATRSKTVTPNEYKPLNSSYNISGTQSAADEDNKKTESAAKAVENEPYEQPAESAVQTVPDEYVPDFTMPVEGTIVKPYSNTGLQYSSTYADMRLHEGVDIKCDEGSVVKAASGGTVTDVFEDELYGKTVTIDHGNGITVRYCGLKDVTVSAGQTVNSGDQIGLSGTVPCECADGPHVHIDALLDGESVSVFELADAVS